MKDLTDEQLKRLDAALERLDAIPERQGLRIAGERELADVIATVNAAADLLEAGERIRISVSNGAGEVVSSALLELEVQEVKL